MAASRPTVPIPRRLLLAAGAGVALALGAPRSGRARPLRDSREMVQRPASPETPAEQRGYGAQSPRSVGATPASPADAPIFSDVAQVEPWDALLYLAGRHPRYPATTIESLMGFSPADILETMDTVMLDAVNANRGATALAGIYQMIAVKMLESLVAVYGSAPVLLALDAGHGGRRGVYYDPGSNGTEAIHARAVVDAVEELAREPRYTAITIRRIFNDAIGDDFGLPPPEDRKGAAALALRNVRASMLAAEVAAWNATAPQQPVALQVLSAHFNAGSGGTLVLHQGAAVPDTFREPSIAYARTYVNSARPALNRSGLLLTPLGLPLGTGLSDDRVLYEPMVRIPSRINPYTGVDRTTFPRRYAMLQASLLQRDYALGALIYHELV